MSTADHLNPGVVEAREVESPKYEPGAHAGRGGPDEPLSVEVADDFGALPISRGEWDEFVEVSGGDFYSSLDWCRVWWRHYGAGRMLRVLLFRSGGRLVGLMPMCISRAGVWGARVRLARYIGSDSTIAVIRLAIAEGWHARVIGAAIDRLLGVDRCDAVLLSPLSGEDSYLAGVREGCRVQGVVGGSREWSPGVYSAFWIPGDFRSFLGALDKKVRDNHRRSMKQLETKFQAVHRVIDSSGEVSEAFDRFADLHARQWAAAGKAGHFGDWPGSIAFTKDLVEAVSAMGRAVFLEIIAGGQVVASMHLFRMGRHAHWRLPARALGSDWDKLSLGNAALISMLEAMSGLGAQRIEAGPGHYEQKLRCGAVETPLVSILVTRRGIGPMARVKLLRWISDLVHLTYYRIWRLRVAPRLPLPRSALLRFWIRTRL